MNRLLMVGAFPAKDKNIFGGNVTDGKALLGSSFPHKYDLILIDSTQKSNPPPILLVRSFYAAMRMIDFVIRMNINKPHAVVLFTADGASLLEKGVMAWISRLYNTPALMFPGSGSLMNSAFESKFKRLWISLCMRGTTQVLCQGPAWQRFAKHVLGFPEKRLPIIYNWTATEKLLRIGDSRSFASTIGAPRLLFLGWLERTKGVFELLEACLSLSKTHKFQLVIAGKGQAEADSRAFVQSQGLQGIVEFVGWVGGEEKEAQLAKADILVLPSWVEGFPNAIVEAMSAKLAVVVTAVGNVPDLITDRQQALLVPPKNRVALEQAIELLLIDRPFREALAGRGHAFARENFSVEQGVTKLTAVIDAVIAERKNRDKYDSIDQWRNPETEVRLRVLEWFYKEPIKSQFIEHPRSVWLLWNYVRNVGLFAVIAKLRSRLSERRRNFKIVGLGIGQVIEAPENAAEILGQIVIFLATNHSSTRKTVVVHSKFIEPLPLSSGAANNFTPSINTLPAGLDLYRAWSPYSGRPIDALGLKQALSAIARNVQVRSDIRPDLSDRVIDKLDVVGSPQKRPSAVLFGLGNYAKSVILPNIAQVISLQRVHEIDPDQLDFYLSKKVSLDTSPVPRDEAKFDVWFIAGFHHTHTDLAIKAIEQGSYAVIEKPLATTREQYDSFTATLDRHPNHRFFQCFQKRYSKLHSYFVDDIGCNFGDPVDMLCSVYEIPLPLHHWYNWPNSGTRIVSNGCHWLDYFMYINDYSPAVEYGKWNPRSENIMVYVRLENGACLSMNLTESGSQRLGMRDYIELRHGGVTVTMTDGSLYSAENRRRVFNKRVVNPLNAYARMYRAISEAVVLGSKGDGLKTLRSTELTLALEQSK